MMTVFFIGVAVAAAASGYYLYRRGQGSDSDRRALPDSDVAGQLETEVGQRELAELRVNDIVLYYDRDFMVEGKVTYRQDAWEWYAYLLRDGEETRWLGVEHDDVLEVRFWDEVDDLRFDEPPSQTIDYDGESFRRTEHGRAEATSVGKTGRRQGMQVEYFEYESSGGRYLSVENWGGDVEVSVGREVDDFELDVLPGDEITA